MPRLTVEQVRQAFLTGEGLPAKSRNGTYTATLEPSGVYMLRMVVQDRTNGEPIAVRFKKYVLFFTAYAYRRPGRALEESLRALGMRHSITWTSLLGMPPSAIAAYMVGPEEPSLEEENV